MAAPVDPAVFKEALVILTAAAVVIPLFHRFKVSPVLGFILVGMAVGPFGIGAFAGAVPWLHWISISDRDAIALVAEFGVVLLMFMIGLEMSMARLKVMRKLVFGLGSFQVGGSILVLGGVLLLLGENTQSALVIAAALAMSSTAIILQVLSEQRRMVTPTGRASFAMLLFQDTMVIPILFVVGMLGADHQGSLGLALGKALGQAALAVGGVVIVGRLVLRPLFRLVAGTQSTELFMAACLLVILAMGLVVTMAGLSMALGALIAGVLLAETEYRRQIEVLIEPFKGLLLGVFLISIGMSLDLGQVAAAPLFFITASIGLIVLKAAVVFFAAPLFGVTQHVGMKSGLLMGPGSEFSFVILGLAASLGVVAQADADAAFIVAALTMAMIPLLAIAGQRLALRLRHAQPHIAEAAAIPDHEGPPKVLVAGYGRVGQMVCSLLETHAIPYLAVDTDTATVAAGRQAGRPVFYGNATHETLLAKCGLADARAVVITSNSPRAVEEIVKATRAFSPTVPIIARARDAKQASLLYGLGATDAVPDALEASLQLAQSVLVDIGVPMGRVIASIHGKRAAMQKQLMAARPSSNGPLPLFERQMKQARADLDKPDTGA
jgi:monovalent cation:H+ antiporter-2, CPA2 family